MADCNVSRSPQRLNSLLKNSRFVSGHRFSDAVDAAESEPASAAVEPSSKQCCYRRGEPLRHPKPVRRLTSDAPRLRLAIHGAVFRAGRSTNKV
jgi:hypothetical protein